jgi:hypothetical protein
MPGIDHILYGTDYPCWNPSTAMKLFSDIGLSPEDQQKILYHNARQFFSLPAPAPESAGRIRSHRGLTGPTKSQTETIGGQAPKCGADSVSATLWKRGGSENPRLPAGFPASTGGDSVWPESGRLRGGASDTVSNFLHL